MQLRPGENFAVVRQLEDPFDSGTYYVQAKIRDARTDELIQTLNLTDSGNQRHTAPWVVASDASGLGRYIDIETMVYTDAGHTTVSDVYRRENQVYLVEERGDHIGHGGSDIDYKKIKQIIYDARNEIGKEGNKGTDANTRKKGTDADAKKITEEITKAVTESKEEILRIVGEGFKGIEKTDLKPVLESIESAKDTVVSAIDAKEVTDPTDLTPVMNKLESMSLKEYQEEAKNLVAQARDIVTADMVKIKEMVGGILTAMKNLSFNATFSSNVKEEKEEEKPKSKRIRTIGSRGFIAQGLVYGIAALFVLAGPASLVMEKFDTPKEEESVNLGDTVGQLQVWVSTTTPSAGITQRSVGKAVRITGLNSCDTIDTDANGYLSCGTDTGGGGAVATTTIRGMFSATSPIVYTSGTGDFSLGTVDISGNTNLTADGTEIVLTGDALSLGNTLIFTNGSTTNATTSNLYISNGLNFGGVTGTTWSAFCTSITGGSGLCDGIDAEGGGGGGSISTSTVPVAGNLAYWTSGSALSDVATGTLTESVTGLELSATRGLVGGSSILSLSSGYGIPLTASTTNWESFYLTPSGRITAGTGIDWSGNTLNGVYTAGDALTLTGEDFDFDGGATPSGDLGGTWASPSVSDDSHAHTGTTLSGIDISSDTNLSVTATGIELSADAIALTTGYIIPLSASTTNWNTFYNTPSNRITDGTGLTWSSNTLNVDASQSISTLSNLTSNGFVKTSGGTGALSIDTSTYLTTVDISANTNLTAGDALTLTDDDIDFDGGTAPAGALGGTWASPTVDDDGHNHTGTTLSGIDISSDTNLSADGTEIVLTGDALSLGTALTFLTGTSTTAFFSGLGTFTNAVVNTLFTAVNAVFTGLVDIGGGTLEIPNGTGLTTQCDDPGEICHDTSDNQLVIDDQVIATKEPLFKFGHGSTSPFFATSTVNYFPIIEDGYTVVDLNCMAVGGGTKLVTMFGETLTCDSDGAFDDGAIAITTIGAASSTVTYTMGAGSGVVNAVLITVTAKPIRE